MLLLLVANKKKSSEEDREMVSRSYAFYNRTLGELGWSGLQLTQSAISPPIVAPEIFEHKINSITQPGPEKSNIRL